ncbi:hypothetical protein [Enterococcus rotai]|uniref:hypothetical protein n=1 Tax=Enterococcus rotai TaxID=118060 RepID=UPI0032B44CD6
MKRRINILLVMLMLISLAACGNNEKKETKPKKELNGKKLKKSEEDVVSERTKEIDGEKVVVKTLKDGTEVALPEAFSLDDVDIQGFE